MGFTVFFVDGEKKYLLFKTSSACQPRCLGGLRVKDDEAIYRTVSPIRISPVKQAVVKIGTQGNRDFLNFFFCRVQDVFCGREEKKKKKEPWKGGRDRVGNVCFDITAQAVR